MLKHFLFKDSNRNFRTLEFLGVYYGVKLHLLSLLLGGINIKGKYFKEDMHKMLQQIVDLNWNEFQQAYIKNQLGTEMWDESPIQITIQVNAYLNKTVFYVIGYASVSFWSQLLTSISRQPWHNRIPVTDYCASTYWFILLKELTSREVMHLYANFCDMQIPDLNIHT